MPLTRIGAQIVRNVRDFGAKGDGTTDDSSALAAAHTAAGSGGIVEYPNGTYVTSGLTVSQASQRVILRPGATIKLKASSNATAVTPSGAGIRFEGGIIDANKANQSSGNGLRIIADDVSVEDTKVLNAYGYGIYAPNVNRTRIVRCRVTDSGNCGIFVETSSGASADVLDVLIDGNIVDRTGVAAGSIVEGGIQVHGYVTGTKYVRGTRVHGNTVRLPTSPAQGGLCIECYGLSPYSSVVGNHTFGGSMGISIDRSDYTSVSGNTAYGASLYGIELAGSSYCAVAGNTVHGNSLTTKGISCSNANLGHNTITGNTISGVVNNGIAVQTGPYTAVAGNVLNMGGGELGIWVYRGSAGSAITGNVLDGNSTGLKAIVIGDAESMTVSGNTCRNFAQHGVQIWTENAVTVDYVAITGNTFKSVNTPVGDTLSAGASLGTRIRAIGNPGLARNGKECDILNYANDVIEAWGTGTPEGTVTAGVGSIFHRRDGGAGTTQYTKESGTGNTGWVAF